MKIDLKNNYFIISFPFNPTIIAWIKGFSGRRWDPKNKVWKIPATVENYTCLLEIQKPECSTEVEAWHEKILKIQQQIQNAQKFKADVSICDYVYKTKPFVHQECCFNFFKELNIGGLFLEMGLGKTKIIIDVICYLIQKNKIKRPVLYVCPNSISENVKNEFKIHSTIHQHVCILKGSRSKKETLLKEKYDVYIVNYEAVNSLEKPLIHRNFDAIICDESTRIKNSHALCSKVLHRLSRKVSYRYIMSGTPVTQCALDIYSQYKFLDPILFGPSFYAFKNKYAIMGGFQDKQVVGYNHLDEMHNKIFSVALRFTKKDCLDLPDKVYETKQFDLSEQERELYNQIKKNIIIEIGDQQITAQQAITKLIKLTQVTSGFVLANDGKCVNIKNSSKLALLKETIMEILPNKMIIWNSYLANIDMISKMLKDMKIKHITFDGRVLQEDRQKRIDEFQNNPDCKVFIGQIKTGGLGLNLTAASYVLYYTNTYSLSDRLQSEDRAHRIGQINKVTYIDLIARKTIEQSIIKILKAKLNLATMLIDNSNINKTLEDLANGHW